jgi:hypothetical protein
VKKHAGVRPSHPPDAGELVRCTLDLQEIRG